MAEPMVPGVTGTLDEAAVAALAGWVRAQGLGKTVTDVEPLAGGSQNVVVRLRIDGRHLVLRRPPPHPRPNSDRTMQREIAVLHTLAGSDVPHPRIVAACDDLDVLGVVFYLMEEVDGFNPGNEIAPAYVHDPQMRHQVGLNYAADVARLGQADWMGSELADWMRPGSFLERQVPQWRSSVAAYRSQDGYDHDSLPGVDDLCDWLDANRPKDYVPGIVHGDIHLNNTMLRREVPEVAAFVDWEMCTIGDPLLDLGWMLVCWPLEPNPLGSAGYLAELGGLATRTELLEAYLDAGGRRTEHLDWYLALACLKLGVVIEGTWARYLAGRASREAGERLHASAVMLMGMGTAVAAGENPFS
ncbi:phosphotransferase family protein [Mycolicibacterium sp.]|uniref:phosphotransferase family protein n=1 Tax=Mycolicibacterium sp. TaxID=2320850 RepID=UPI0025CE64FA|nr:phosphotransferase family protein [Mycolicibacterium sp.]